MKKLSLNEVAEMFEMISMESRLFYNTETGEFEYYNEYVESSEDAEKYEDDVWIGTPSQYDFNEYDMMEEFMETVVVLITISDN